MSRVEGEIVIERPVEEVFDFVADERNEPRFNPQMTRAEKLSSGPIGAGTRFRAEMVRMGRTAEMTTEFTGFERPRRLESSTHLSHMDIQGALTFDPVPEGTRARWVWDLELHGLLRLAGPLVARMGERQERAIWTSLSAFSKQLSRLLAGGRDFSQRGPGVFRGRPMSSAERPIGLRTCSPRALNHGRGGAEMP